MITLVASIVGFLGSIFPEIIKIFRDKQDKTHELEILDRQIQFATLKLSGSLQEIEIERNLQEYNALYNTYTSGIHIIDSINGLVRPLLAYSFFIMYVFVKFTQYKHITNNNGLLVEYLNILWNTDDQAIFAGMVSFYFGQRTFTRLWKKHA